MVAHISPAPVEGGGREGRLSPGSCLCQQLALRVKPGMQLPWLLKSAGIPGLLGPVCAVSFLSCEMFHSAVPRIHQQSDSTRTARPPAPAEKVEITESSCPIADNVWVPLLFGALKWDRAMLSRPTVSMPALSRPGADVSRTQECTRGRVWRGQKATHLRRHSRDTKRNQWGQSGGEGGAKEKQLAMEESVKMTLKNY